MKQEYPFVLSWISAAVLGFCLFVLINTLYISPAYQVAGVYFPATLLIAFFAASRCPDWFVQTGFKLFCSVTVLLAVWALVQWLTGWGFLDEKSVRALALFITPNTLATMLNLGLTPILAFYLLGSGGRSVYGLILLLFSALLATQSRGGYLGLLAGILFLLSFVGQASIVAQWPRYRAVAVGFLAALSFFKLYAWLGLASWSMDAVFATLSHGDSSYRWEIYQVVWNGLAENLWMGGGYFNFGYYFEAHKVPPFLDSSFFYVHDDYLQFAFELGLVGLALFLLLIIIVYRQVFKFRQQAMTEHGLPFVMSAIAITSLLVHALVDYPLYMPVFQAVFGAYLGIINWYLIGMGAAHWRMPKIQPQHFLGLSPGFIGNMLLIGLMAWFGLPAFATIAGSYSMHRLLHGDVQQGLLWNSVARTLQPRLAGYYWQEGILLRDQGVAQTRPDLLEKSNTFFSKGIEVNPFEVNNLLEKIALHRKYGALLKQPATHQDIMTWINHAKSLQPHSIGVQIEYVHCLAFIGERAQAIEQAKALMHRWPQFKAGQSLLESVSHD
ncbi:MAG: O-antigen ligase family protein [Methylobacter sp.]